jgi:hypothetical protein
MLKIQKGGKNIVLSPLKVGGGMRELCSPKNVHAFENLLYTLNSTIVKDTVLHHFRLL